MSDVQETVDDLRFILQREVIEDRPELWSLVRRYGSFCHEVNVRLRQCEKCLKQGLRSEAIQLAEVSPNLLDAVATLDFAERSQLQDVVDMYFEDPPEPLLLEVAAALNEAYALQEPLQKLLDQHRLLAIARRPLKERLAILRSLADTDSGTPHWNEDVVVMEKARQGEMETESRTAVASGDVSILKRLTEEAQANVWRTEFPASLLRNLKARGGQTARKQAQARLQELNTELHTAFSALDSELARQLRDEWKRNQQIAQMSEDDRLCLDVAPVLAWLEDEDQKLAVEERYAAGIHAIEQALENDELSADDLVRLGFQIEEVNRSLPDALGRRFRTRIQTLQIGDSRRRKLVYAAGAAVFIAGVGIFGMIVYSVQEAEKTRRLVAAVDDLISEGKLIEARRLADVNATSSADSWLSVQKKLVDAEQAERDRILQWNAEMEEIQSMTSHFQVEAALKKARELARTEEEKIEVGKWEKTWKQRVNEETAKREKEFRQLLASAVDSLQIIDRTVEGDNNSDLNRLRELIKTATFHLDNLNKEKSGVAKELASQAALLESRLQASRKLVTELGRKADLMEKLTKLSFMPLDKVFSEAEVEGYAVTLRQFVTEFPNDPRASLFKAAAETCPVKSVYAKQDMLRAWKKLQPANEREIETRLRDISSFTSDHLQSPDLELIRQYEAWLTSVQRRFSDNGDRDEGALSRLERLFNSKFIKDGHIFQDKQGNTYYLPEEKEVKGSVSKFGFKYQIGFNNETKTENKSPDELLKIKTQSPPQQEIAAKVRLSLQRIGVDGWNDYFLDLTETILKNGQLDPFLRYLLLLKTLEFASLGDFFLEQNLEPVLTSLNDDKLDRSVAWIDPHDKNAKEARNRAKELLATVPPLEPLFNRAKERQKQFGHSLFTPKFAVGFLEKTNQGKWLCRTNWTPTDGFEVRVVSRPDANGQRTWQILGQIENSNLQIDSAVAQAAGEASVVFAVRKDGDLKTARLP